MTELVHFQLLELPACRLVGKELRVPQKNEENPIPAFWSRCFAEDIFTPLEQMKDSLFPEALFDAPDAYLDWMGDMEPDGSWRCLVGMIMKPDAVPPEGYAYRDLPACTLALGQVKGTEPEIYTDSEGLIMPRVRETGRLPGSFMMEVYACPRFTTPDPADGTVILDCYLQLK